MINYARRVATKWVEIPPAQESPHMDTKQNSLFDLTVPDLVDSYNVFRGYLVGEPKDWPLEDASLQVSRSKTRKKPRLRKKRNRHWVKIDKTDL